MLDNVATISIDTSGDALHRRGYRTKVLRGGAPLKETLAAAMLMLSRWTPDRPLYDPFCGSGDVQKRPFNLASVDPPISSNSDAETPPRVDQARFSWRRP